MLKKLCLTVSAAALCAGAAMGVAALATPAQAASGVNAGVLTCHEDSGWGFIFGSSHGLQCTYSETGEHYTGSIDKFGVDIGYLKGGVLIWGVVAPTAHLHPGDLAGHYGGLTAGATAGVGADANALIGGSNNAIELQPLSIESNRGLNIAAGIGQITLHPAP